MTHGAVSAADCTKRVSVDVTELCWYDESSLEKIRLESLRDAPHAFVTTESAEQEKATDAPGYWAEQLTRHTWVVAENAGEIVGIAALVEPDEASPEDCLFVESVWVENGHRCRGVLRQMMEELELRTVVERGVCCLQLWVLDTNGSAERAYERLGFERIPERDQVTSKAGPHGTPVMERLMRKRLA